MGKINEQNLQLNLAHLQNLIKRDAQSYHDEFVQQLRRWRKSPAIVLSLSFPPPLGVHLLPFTPHLDSLKQIFTLKPTEEAKDFVDLANFLSHVQFPLYWILPP